MITIRRVAFGRMNNIHQLVRATPNLSTEKDANIVMIRHAESVFNAACKIRARELDITHLPWNQQDKNDEFSRSASFNPEYMDCSITEKGRKQCEEAAEKLKNVEVDLVLVSPKIRTLETCDIIFRNRNIPVKVQPLLSEACRYACDGVHPEQFKEKVSKYAHFTFEHDLSEDYVYNINAEQIEQFQQYCRENGIISKMDRDLALMKKLREFKVYESDEELRERAWKVKLMLKGLAEEQGYKNICIVSHWYLLTYLCSRKFSEESENIDYDWVHNCSPVTKKLSELLKVR